MRSLTALLPYFRPYRLGIAVGLTLVIVSNLFTVAGPWVLKMAVDALERELRPDLILRYALVLTAISVVAGATRFWMRKLLNGLSRRMETDIRSALFAHLLSLPPQFFDAWRTGDLVSRSTNDVQAVRMVAGPAIMYAVNTATVATLALGLMIWIDPMLTLWAMIPMVVLPPIVFLFGRQIHERFERIQAQFSEISNFAQENLAGTRIVKAYVREEAQTRRFATLNRDYKSRNLSLARVWGLFHPSLMFFTGVGAVVVLWFGGGQVIRGAITLGDFVAFSFYLTMLMWPMIALGWVTNLFQRGAASMGRLNELFNIVPAVRDPESPVPLASVRGALEFDDVSFRYPETKREVLRNISFRIEPGQTVAIVGATASGKSTLAALIPRLYDVTAGTIRLDGVDIRELDLGSLRDAMAFVPQEPFLFSMRLRMNIELRYGGTDAGEPVSDELRSALDVSQLEKTLAVLPDGIDTRLGERGINLSGGQKQRATLARAVHRDAPVLILDDALSAVDSETETAILEALREYMSGRTSIIVSHRVSAVRTADSILVLDDGRLVERGNHEDLIAADGVYARLLRRQLVAEELERIEQRRVASA
ncbi:MAG: ABC transporter ATP-binding protein [Gemmatimonadales bacterium]|nr:ABC transporter ATP-binding protein [Gemmatimonadales bacterium]MYH11009.1 ABC transporter ATP-binding protein [Gemmatimonadales bacterium]